VGFWNGINTDDRKKVRFNFFHSGSKAVDNSYNNYNIRFGLTYRPTNALRVSAFPSYGINNDKLQFINNIDLGTDTRYLNGSIEQRTFSMSFRLNYTINPNLSIQYWGQPFISRGRYSDFKYITNPTAAEFNDRITLYNANQLTFENDVYSVDENLDGITDYSFDNPDFSFVQFRSNLVIRWEYIPGSEIFLVWSQEISQSADPQAGLIDSLNENIFGDEKPMNIFLIKATYRFIF
jgi:hypothetical protein